MKTIPLGQSGLEVSRLCFGTLTMGPLQAGIPVEEGAELLHEAYRRGINFWDTAELYYNYPYLRLALKKIGGLPVLATKAYVFSADDARKSLEMARRDLDLDVMPIMMLHEQESALTLQGHRPALEYFLQAREKGLIQAVGISCHTVAAAKAAVDFDGIDLLHPILNRRGVGIKDGTLDEMLSAVRGAYDAGLGIYAMKVLGGGHLIPEAEEAVAFVRELDCVHAYAVGMSSLDELEANLCYLEGRSVPGALAATLRRKKRRLHIGNWCDACGACVEGCPQGALYLAGRGDRRRARVREERCILCGYCGAYCPEFCIKIY